MKTAGRAGIQLAGVVKAFSGTPVLRGVDLEVAAGELLALMGTNGAGKSTLLRVLATTVLPDAGRVFVDGIDVTRSPGEARRRIGVCLSEERSWYSQISGRRNLEFFASLQGLRRAERCTRSAAVLHEVGLDEAADRPFSTYSTGMRLRMALARALLHDPHVLLLDEPTRSLDPTAAGEFMDRLLAAAHDDGCAIFMVTHDVGEAGRADVVAVLRDGVVSETTRGAQPAALLAAIG